MTTFVTFLPVTATKLFHFMTGESSYQLFAHMASSGKRKKEKKRISGRGRRKVKERKAVNI